MKVYAVLENLLKSEPNYTTDDGELKKWVVINKAQNYDEALISLLLENEEIKSYFFITVKNVLVFNQALFIQFLEQKNYLKDSFTAYKNKIGLTIDGKFLNQRNEVALIWPYKDCLLEGGQSSEEDKRKEIFFNEILAQDEINQLLEPKVLTNAKRYTVDGERPWETFNRNSEGVITDNLIIKGNNLLALHTLKEEFAGKVKLIYIDPPYNTGNDGFKYNDSFNHSTWLTFMRNRLQIAKELIREDGVIFIQCDDNEQAYLKVLCDEVFDRENTESMIWHKVGDDAGRLKITYRFRREHEYIICCYKNKQIIRFNKFKSERNYKNEYTNPDDDFRGPYKQGIISHTEEISKETGKNFFEVKTPGGRIVKRQWRVTKIEFDELVLDNRIYFGKDGNSIPSLKVFISEEKDTTPISIVQGVGTAKSAGFHHLNIFGEKVFSYPKPEEFLKRLIEISTKENDIVLDYHLGSGTTAAVAHKMNRQYIGIEQMDYIETVAVERLKKVIDGEQGGISKAVNWQGGGGFVYVELKTYNQNFIDEIVIAKDTKEILNIWENMKAKSFLNYNVDIKKQEEHLEDFKTLTLEEQKQHLVSLLDKNQLYVNRSHMYDADYSVSEEEIALTKDFYQL